MSETKFTPGPWAINSLTGPTEIAAVKPFRDIGVAYTDGYGADATGVANARLMAAAPDLYEALTRLLASHGPGNAEAHQPGCQCAVHEAMAALAKARAEPTP